MSLQRIQQAFQAMDSCEAWSLYLLRIRNSKRKGTEYASLSINLTPQGKLTDIVQEISTHFFDNENDKLKSYTRVQDYDGTADSNTIYKLNAQSPLIKEEYSALVHALANTEYEADLLSQKLQAYVIQGDINLNGDYTGIKLFSMQNPITTLKHKFWHEKNTFKEISSKVLSLRSTIDVLTIKDDIYFFSMAGEKLFNMERAYRAICDSKVAMLEQSGILYDSNVFGKIARTGHRPRMFVSFNENRYNRLQDSAARQRYAELFAIPLKEGLFDTSEPKSADKLVKLLCNKGMVDPFENLPVEVSGARKWQ